MNPGGGGGQSAGLPQHGRRNPGGPRAPCGGQLAQRAAAHGHPAGNAQLRGKRCQVSVRLCTRATTTAVSQCAQPLPARSAFPIGCRRAYLFLPSTRGASTLGWASCSTGPAAAVRATVCNGQCAIRARQRRYPWHPQQRTCPATPHHRAAFANLSAGVHAAGAAGDADSRVRCPYPTSATPHTTQLILGTPRPVTGNRN